MWELDHKEGWALKNWCFQIVVLEKTLERVSLTARRSNQSILKEVNPEYSLEGLMMKSKLQYFGHVMWRADSLEKILLGKIEGRKRRGRQRMRWLDSITNSMGVNLGKLQEIVQDMEALCIAVPGVEELDMTSQLKNKAIIIIIYHNFCGHLIVYRLGLIRIMVLQIFLQLPFYYTLCTWISSFWSLKSVSKKKKTFSNFSIRSFSFLLMCSSL